MGLAELSEHLARSGDDLDVCKAKVREVDTASRRIEFGPNDIDPADPIQIPEGMVAITRPLAQRRRNPGIVIDRPPEPPKK